MNLAKVKVAGSRPVFRSIVGEGFTVVSPLKNSRFLVGRFKLNKKESSNKAVNYPTESFYNPLTLRP